MLIEIGIAIEIAIEIVSIGECSEIDPLLDSDPDPDPDFELGGLDDAALQKSDAFATLSPAQVLKSLNWIR